MKKLTVVQAAEYFGISKEAIHNRIRRGSLESVVEDENKFVLVDITAKAKTTPKPRVVRKSQTPNDRYYKLLEEQNAKLQERVTTLEGETRSLRDQKELMLIEERKKIEQIYREKDEQLKNVLNTLSQQFMLNAPSQVEEEALEVEMLEVEEKSELISLKKYLKKTTYSDKKVAKIKAKLLKKSKKDERVILKGSKIYLDLSKHDYGDLLPIV